MHDISSCGDYSFIYWSKFKTEWVWTAISLIFQAFSFTSLSSESLNTRFLVLYFGKVLIFYFVRPLILPKTHKACRARLDFSAQIYVGNKPSQHRQSISTFKGLIGHFILISQDNKTRNWYLIRFFNTKKHLLWALLSQDFIVKCHI